MRADDLVATARRASDTAFMSLAIIAAMLSTRESDCNTAPVRRKAASAIRIFATWLRITFTFAPSVRSSSHTTLRTRNWIDPASAPTCRTRALKTQRTHKEPRRSA